MARFLFIYRDSAEMASDQMSPDQMQAQMEKWMSWLGQGQAEGWVENIGDPLQPDGRVIDSNKSVTDGPFVESRELVGGYSIIKADDYDSACQHAMGCPVYETGGRVEIRQIAAIDSPNQ